MRPRYSISRGRMMVGTNKYGILRMKHIVAGGSNWANAKIASQKCETVVARWLREKKNLQSMPAARILRVIITQGSLQQEK